MILSFIVDNAARYAFVGSLCWSLLSFVALTGCDAEQNVASVAPSQPLPSDNVSFEQYLQPAANRSQVAGVRFYSEIPYDRYRSTTLDLFLPDSAAPTGLVIYAHGGGFIVGDKSEVYQQPFFAQSVEKLLAKNVAFATVNYRLVAVEEAEIAQGDAYERAPYAGVLTSIQDIQRSLQFMRFFAADFNIDVNRVALYGVSAGAGSSLWIGLQDEMADLDADGISKQSTRVSAIAALETQATYDVVAWFTDILAPFQLTLADIINVLVNSGERLESSPYGNSDNWRFWTSALLALFDIETVLDLELSALEAERAAFDMLRFVSNDDPPLWIESTEESAELPMDIVGILHHPYHALAMKNQADAQGLQNQAYLPALDIYPQQDQTVIDFLLRHVSDH